MTKKELSLKIFLSALAIFLFTTPKLAQANPLTSSSDVSATVPSETFFAPTLISPANGSSGNNPRYTFIWQRPGHLPTVNLNHYDLYIDNAIFAASVPDSLSSQSFYFYEATASSGIFYITLNQDISQGYHTWRVAVFDNDGTNATTGDWTFYLDSIAPFISFTKLNSTTYAWNTSVSGSIPEESQRYLTIYGASPTLKGNVETNANLQIALACPSPTPSGCSNQSWIINSTDGTWEKQFTNLVANINYTVSLSATDATNNTTIFPNFYLKYAYSTTTPTITTSATVTTTATLTPLPTLSPMTKALPTVTSKLTPPPDLSALITPTPFVAKAPPAPTVPPQKTPLSGKDFGYGYFILFFFLLLGLPTHLFLSCLAVGAKFNDVLNFIFTLGFPFLKRKNISTIPFSFVELYKPTNLNKCLYKTVSDIKGNLYFPKNLPDQCFVILRNTNFTWKNQIMSGLLLRFTCLLPAPKRFLDAKEALQNNLYTLKSIPLIVAIITSSIGAYFYSNSYIFIYLYLSLQYSFSEYYYPKIAK